MKVEQNDSQVAGSAPGQDVGNTDLGSNRNPDGSVKYESFDKLVGQLKKTKEEKEILARQVNEFEAEKRRIEEAKLAEQGEFQKLLEMRNAEIQKYQTELESERGKSAVANKTLVDAQKLQAVYEELPGRIKNSKYMQFIDLDSVAYNPETGDVDRESAKLSANKFADEHKGLLDTSHIGRLPGDSASTSQQISAKFKDLSLKEMRSNLGDAVRQKKQELGI